MDSFPKMQPTAVSAADGIRSVIKTFIVAQVELQSVKSVACGYAFTVFAVNHKFGQIMGTGVNKEGQIGNLI